ncbi:outer membrane beta-barrel protein [Aureivirga marina]|uniref:outer membrane beta-barrel protein n=1 Tax=Aureivirga marina TaxID=1182451 RepID=UPI0018C9BC0D|nr:outer membrane beta-barrel protein [Aureivirga marina]
MKLSNLFLVLTLFCATILQAQDVQSIDNTEYKRKKFSITMTGGLGYATINPDNGRNYNLDANVGEILFNYNFMKNIGVSSGIGTYFLSGNGFDDNGNFYHERSLLKIPLNLSFTVELNKSFEVMARYGVYAQTIILDEYQYATTTLDDVYEGWNFGTNLGIDFIYKANEKMSVGLTYAGQSDFKKFDINSKYGTDQKQKIIGMNTLGFLFRFEF